MLQDTLSHLLSPLPPPQTPTHILPHAIKTSGVGSTKQPVPIGKYHHPLKQQYVSQCVSLSDFCSVTPPKRLGLMS